LVLGVEHSRRLAVDEDHIVRDNPVAFDTGSGYRHEQQARALPSMRPSVALLFGDTPSRDQRGRQQVLKERAAGQREPEAGEMMARGRELPLSQNRTGDRPSRLVRRVLLRQRPALGAWRWDRMPRQTGPQGLTCLRQARTSGGFAGERREPIRYDG